MKTTELAKKIKCSAATINLWRSGHALPSQKNTDKIAHALNTGACFLLFGQNHGAAPQNKDLHSNIFSNSQPMQGKSNKNDKIKTAINEHIKKLIDEADKKPFALEHLLMELSIRLPRGIYDNYALGGE